MTTGFPAQLKCILEAPEIPKVGVGFTIDRKILYDAVGDGLVIRNFADVGLMTKFCNPEMYLAQDQMPLGLERCVQDLLDLQMGKSGQKSLRWDAELMDYHKLCESITVCKGRDSIIYIDAGLDGQASLEVYNIIAPAIDAKALTINRPIPQDWYTFDCCEGRPTRLLKSKYQGYLIWAAKFCTWYQNGKFIGYEY